MYYAVVIFPRLRSEGIEAIRRKHDPTVDLIAAHVTVLFPVPHTVGVARLIDHLEGALAGRQRFEIRLGGLRRSRDHWLLLGLEQGADVVEDLHRDVYSGILAPFRRDDLEFEPHLALGLFLRQGARYDWDHPRAGQLDEKRFEAAREEARALTFEDPCPVGRLHLVEIPDAVLAWATGNEEGFPRAARARVVRELPLVGTAA